MKIIGLTGGSGAGKGEADRIFQKHGVPFIDTDAVYHELLLAGDDMTSELVAAFGKEILGTDGTVDRPALAAVVFGKEDSPRRLHTLNNITHKYIMSETQKRLTQFETAGAFAAVVDAPLLFEAGFDKWCDISVAILADRETRIARIMARDGISREAAEHRIDAQHDDAFFRAHCHTVLENNGSEQELETQILALLAALKGE